MRAALPDRHREAQRASAGLAEALAGWAEERRVVVDGLAGAIDVVECDHASISRLSPAIWTKAAVIAASAWVAGRLPAMGK